MLFHHRMLVIGGSSPNCEKRGACRRRAHIATSLLSGVLGSPAFRSDQCMIAVKTHRTLFFTAKETCSSVNFPPLCASLVVTRTVFICGSRCGVTLGKQTMHGMMNLRCHATRVVRRNWCSLHLDRFRIYSQYRTSSVIRDAFSHFFTIVLPRSFQFLPILSVQFFTPIESMYRSVQSQHLVPAGHSSVGTFMATFGIFAEVGESMERGYAPCLDT